MRSEEVRGKQFSTHRRGYDTTEVAAFLEEAGLRLAAMESTDRPAGALVSGDIRFGWAEWVESTTFETHPEAYDGAEVDAFREEIRDTFIGVRKPPMRSMRFAASGSPRPTRITVAMTRSRLPRSSMRPV